MRNSSPSTNRGLFEGVADAIIVIDAQGRLHDANTAASELFGYDRAELLQLNLAGLDRQWLAANSAPSDLLPQKPQPHL